MSPGARTPIPDRHAQRRQDELGPQVVCHGPAHHATTEDVQDHRQEEKAFLLGGHVRDVTDPEFIGSGGHKGPLDQIGSVERAAGSRRVVRMRVRRR